MKYSRLPSSKPSEASVFQSPRNQKSPRDCEEWQLTGSGPIDGTNGDAPVFTSGLHLRSSPPVFTSPFLARSTRDSRARAACCSVQTRRDPKRTSVFCGPPLRSRRGHSPIAQPRLPRSRRPPLRVAPPVDGSHFSPASGLTFRSERWNVQSDAYTRPPPPPPAE